MLAAADVIQTDANRIGFAPIPGRWEINFRALARQVVIAAAAAIVFVLGGCTGTVQIEPTDLSTVEIGASRKTVEEAIGKPILVYESQGSAVAAYQYDIGGTRHYHVGGSSGYPGPVEQLLLLPIALPLTHLIASSVERHRLRESQRAWLCVTYLNNQLVAEMKYSGQVECEPPGKLAGEKIQEIFAGTVSVGYDLDDKVGFTAEIAKDGALRIEYKSTSLRPLELAGKWWVENNLWCRTIRRPPPETAPLSTKCQTVIKENEAYIFIDANGARVSRISASDISRRLTKAPTKEASFGSQSASATVEAKPSEPRAVDPARQARIEKYIATNERRFVASITAFAWRIDSRGQLPTIISYDVIEANEQRTVIKVTLQSGMAHDARPVTRLYRARWVGNDLEVVAQSDVPSIEAKSW